MSTIFNDWCATHGVGHDAPVIPQDFPITGRGMAALRHIEAGEVVMNVPRACLMVWYDSLSSACANFLRFALPTLTKTQCLALWLIYERSSGKNSPWHAYITSLPASYDCFSYWHRSEVKAIHTSSLRRAAMNCAQEYRQQYIRVRKLITSASGSKFAYPLPVQRVTYWDYVWAVCTISTRACYFNDEQCKSVKGEEPGCLVPLLDMFNHTHTAVAEAYFDGQAYCVRTTRSYEVGEQVFIHYGAHGNTSLLQTWGFAYPGNTHSTADVDAFAAIPRRVLLGCLLLHRDMITEMGLLTPSQQERLVHQLQQEQSSACSRAHTSARLRCCISYDGTPQWSVFTLLRLCADVHIHNHKAASALMSEGERRGVSFRVNSDRLLEDRALCRDSEAVARAWVRDAAAQQLQTYEKQETELKQKIKGKKGIPTGTRNSTHFHLAVVHNHETIQILRKCMQWCEQTYDE